MTLVCKSRRTDDLLAVGKILCAVGYATDLHTLIWLGETCVQSSPAERPGIRSMRIHLVKVLRQITEVRFENSQNDTTNNTHSEASRSKSLPKAKTPSAGNHNAESGKSVNRQNDDRSTVKSELANASMENSEVNSLRIQDSFTSSKESIKSEKDSDIHTESKYSDSCKCSTSVCDTNELESDCDDINSEYTTELCNDSKSIDTEESLWESDFSYTENSSEVVNLSDSSLKDSDFDDRSTFIDEN